MLVSQWFLTLFSYSLRPPMLLRVLDLTFTDGWKAMFRFGLARLRSVEVRGEERGERRGERGEESGEGRGEWREERGKRGKGRGERGEGSVHACCGQNSGFSQSWGPGEWKMQLGGGVGSGWSDSAASR